MPLLRVWISDKKVQLFSGGGSPSLVRRSQGNRGRVITAFCFPDFTQIVRACNLDTFDAGNTTDYEKLPKGLTKDYLTQLLTKDYLTQLLTKGYLTQLLAQDYLTQLLTKDYEPQALTKDYLSDYLTQALTKNYITQLLTKDYLTQALTNTDTVFLGSSWSESGSGYSQFCLVGAPWGMGGKKSGAREWSCGATRASTSVRLP